MSRIFLKGAFAACFVFVSAPFTFAAESDDSTAMNCEPVHDQVADLSLKRTVCVDVVALDQVLVYNRFGSFNPYGMIFALRRDVAPMSDAPEHYTADACDALLGTEAGGSPLRPGEVRLRDCKRPRPLTLRANVGDLLHVRLDNLLREAAPGISETFCRKQPDGADTLLTKLRDWVTWGDKARVDHGEATCDASKTAESPESAPEGGDWPRTRTVNFAIQGLRAVANPHNKQADGRPDDRCIGLAPVVQGDPVECFYAIQREGPYFLASTAAPSGGEGDGGSLTHGLFGAVVAEPADTQWYRSQVSKAAFDAAWSVDRLEDGQLDAVTNAGDMAPYEALGPNDVPILNMLRELDGEAYEIVHSDLNAIVHRAPEYDGDPDRAGVIYREFSVFFHDELKTFVTRNYEELGLFAEGQLAGVKDGFAINYGSSGMGAMVLANRKGIGPAADCIECLYEEFFLTSWANGDPALLEQFSEDPSNVHHSYLNDPVVFRNFHAGPKETHVFHLHAHQWFSGNDANRGAYLDSQTVAPQQGFTYRIYGGGMEIYRRGEDGETGWYDTLGSGNRNRTVGDSIFHCHLYPHFAQGMWELWRVHDTLEDGSRKLPDGQWEPSLSLAEMKKEIRELSRPGSVDPVTGAWNAPVSDADGDPVARQLGTPIPAVVPLPGQPWPVLPTYGDPDTPTDTDTVDAMPGYPFYIAGQPGHRPPQPPMDIARNPVSEPGDEFLDGGLPRHVVNAGKRIFPFEVPDLDPAPTAAEFEDALNGGEKTDREIQQQQIVAKALALGDMSMKIETMDLNLLDYDGTPLERAAMAFHHDGSGLTLKAANGSPSTYDPVLGGYTSPGGVYSVNGAPGKPGAPYADPCGAPDTLGSVTEAADSYTHQQRTVFFVDGDVDLSTTIIPEADRKKATALEVTGWVKRLHPDATPKDRPKLYTVGDDGTQQEIIGPIQIIEADPFLVDTEIAGVFTADPAVVGYRRYEASAVQLDLVTNRAGWHDPQARINVLTRNSGKYKNADIASQRRISPVISASEEPFFFRALSGECIEFRHTNELPKELELDDFQVKTPTDTIGQHIHLVKFDVTSSDGSGNGFNYEDGTFAPDEIALRICAAKNGGAATNPNRPLSALELREAEGLCVEKDGKWQVAEEFKDIWRKALQEGENRKLFQTTVQRWFADPILSATRADGDGDSFADRTLKTVFSHDHFGPSSIQQHGFYTALVIEPQRSQTCPANSNGTASGCTDQRNDRALVLADDSDVGARKVIHDPDIVDRFDETLIDQAVVGTLNGPGSIEDRTYREFALAVADFALLYDPRDRLDPAEFDAALNGTAGHTFEGMGTLVCEARYQDDPEKLRDICGSAIATDESDPTRFFAPAGNAAPAWIANGRPGDISGHDISPGVEISAIEFDDLRKEMIAYRQKAAGYDPDADPAAPLAKPVVAPQRPESISVDHHDPYLVNYRGEPIPLRVGKGNLEGEDCDLKELDHWVASLETGVRETCSVRQQRPGDRGDMANVFLSAVHGDPATPVFESLSGDKVQFRLIQGAQEVQHTFTLEGYTWPRHIDQAFPAGSPILDDITAAGTLTHACTRLDAARMGRPDQYSMWLRLGPEAFANAGDRDYWNAYETFLGECFNATGRIPAQEVGISEHFEFQGVFRQEATGLEAVPSLQDRASDTLLHFGSSDALWNGAWGLFRVHENAGETDIVALENSRRLLLADGNEAIASTLATFPPTQVFGCANDAPRVYAAVVAIEASTVFGKLSEAGDWGTPYGPRYYDRNGLFLALVDPRELLAPEHPASVTPEDLGNTQLWKGIRLSTISAAITRKYDRPEPFVLSVNAGDCVKLAVLNALRDTGEGDPSGLWDDLGDARMPPIVPLNVEPVWSHTEGDGNEPWTFEQTETVNLRPSARLALTFPLPVLNHRQNVAMPFGGNGSWALAGIPAVEDPALSICPVPGGGGAADECMDMPDSPRSSQIELLTFYAGRASAPKDLDFDPIEQVSEAFGSAFGSTDTAWTQIRLAAESEGFVAFGEITPSEQSEAVFRVGSRLVDIGVLAASGPQVMRNILPADRHRAMQALLDDLTGDAQAAILDDVHFIPYAYGALPIKSMGDIIGHGAHGLFGSVNIMPKSATLEDGQTRTEIAPGHFVAAPMKSQPVWISRIETDLAGTAHPIRQFTLFWHDGLNLRDSDTGDIFKGYLPPGSSTAVTPSLVAECEVCDDSYDLGDQGVNYRSASFGRVLRGRNGNSDTIERHYNLNAFDFSDGVFKANAATPVLRAEAGEEVVIHLVHPGGRARQRAFVTIAQDYDDLFPDFGFPHSALLAPGKSMSASLTEVMREGCYLWFDGPLHLRSGGTWGLLDVVPSGRLDTDDTSCN